jgi:hypothetical protein
MSLYTHEGHIFVQVGSELLLLDTGAPMSFGTEPELTIAGKRFSVSDSFMGLTAESLSRYVGTPTSGLIGADILGSFDIIIDAPANSITFSTAQLEFNGQSISLDLFMGIPIVSANIVDAEHRMFFDTGAQISYLQHEVLSCFPGAGLVTDFYPGIGQFQTETHTVNLRVGGMPFTVRCGRLPELFGMTLMMAGTQGILGNEILLGRSVGYFPRRRILSM